MARLELVGLSVLGLDGRSQVLHELDLTVADGEVVTVVGTGRSTLLRAVLGLAEVVAGELRIDGEPATDWIPAERRLATVFQDHAPYPHLRVRDNLALPLRFAGLPAGEVGRRVEAVAGELGLTVHLDRMPSQLTGAQRQRLALGRVLVRPSPAAYLLDEPVPGEQALRSRLRQRIAGVTTLWACAEAAEAAALGDRVAVLRDGRLAQVGTARELSERPAGLDVARLVPLNLLLGTVDGDQLRLPVGSLPVPAAAAGRDSVLVGIRPADLTDTEPATGGPPALRVTALAGEGAEADGTARLRHPAMARAAEADPRLSAELLARVDPAGRRAVTAYLHPDRLLLFDPRTGDAL